VGIFILIGYIVNFTIWMVFLLVKTGTIKHGDVVHYKKDERVIAAVATLIPYGVIIVYLLASLIFVLYMMFKIIFHGELEN